jgi:hypothetical protein
MIEKNEVNIIGIARESNVADETIAPGEVS